MGEITIRQGQLQTTSEIGVTQIVRLALYAGQDTFVCPRSLTLAVAQNE